MVKTQKIEFKNFSWINITNPDEKTMNQIREEYDFHPLDIADCLSMSHRSKVDAYPTYTFVVLLFPIYDRKTREIKAAELDMFIGDRFLITVENGNFDIFSAFFNRFKLSSHIREEYSDKSPEKLVYKFLSKLFMYVFPMVDHITGDCDKIEETIFSGKEKKMISEILIIRRNVTDFRKIMQAHKNVLKKMVYALKENSIYVMKKTDVYFESLIDYTKEIWDMLENLKERIEALQQTNESQISFKLSDIMKTLTVISVITFPVTLLATVFGMNTLKAMPFVNNPHGFWYVTGIMIVIVVSMLMIFKKKKWL